MKYPYFLFALVVVFLTTTGCQTSKVLKFEPASQGAKSIAVSLVPFGQTQQGGEPLGTLPFEIDIEKIKGKSLRLSSSGYDDQFWVIPDQLGENNTVKIRLKRRIDNQDQITADQARASLLLMKSYKALTERKLDLAKSLADQSEEVLNLGPGTAIIRAIATWQEGDGTKARTMMEETKALYPNTAELDELLQAIKAQ